MGFEAELREAGLPYTKTWESGHAFGSGTEHFRVDGRGVGSLKSFDPYDPDKEALEDLIAKLGDNPKPSNEYVKEYQRLFHVIPWLDQDEILQAV